MLKVQILKLNQVNFIVPLLNVLLSIIDTYSLLQFWRLLIIIDLCKFLIPYKLKIYCLLIKHFK